MNRLKIGIRLESLGLPLRQGLRKAQQLGVRGVQVDAAGDLSPHNLSQTGRGAFRHLLRSHNLELTALGIPLRRSLDNPEGQQQRIDDIKSVLGLSVDLGPRIATVEFGRIPAQDNDAGAHHLIEPLQALGRHGDRIGAVLALQTGLQSGAMLRAFLDRFDTGGLGVNLDPANLLISGFDPYESARALRNRIVHSNAKDARVSGASHTAQEMPLGQGDIDWLLYLGVLEEIEYAGWVTVERATGDNRIADVAAGIEFMGRYVAAPA